MTVDGALVTTELSVVVPLMIEVLRTGAGVAVAPSFSVTTTVDVEVTSPMLIVV